ALAAAAAANGGMMPSPRLTLDRPNGASRRAMAEDEARRLLAGIEAAAKGPSDDRVFVGVGRPGSSRIVAVAVVAERGADGSGAAGRAGRTVLDAAAAG
ncbi:MAG: hypothetical protein NTZ05_07455, partial [Chloroflexi bacterium]|nr:hypothetical protein [Chloroflexota bacterium]